MNDGSIRIEDEVDAQSEVEIVSDYVSHPASGGRILDGRCVVETTPRDATSTRRPPPESGRSVRADPAYATTADGAVTDRREIPHPGEPRMAFGSLAALDGSPWATISNHDLDLTVRIDGETRFQPYASAARSRSSRRAPRLAVPHAAVS